MSAQATPSMGKAPPFVEVERGEGIRTPRRFPLNHAKGGFCPASSSSASFSSSLVQTVFPNSWRSHSHRGCTPSVDPDHSFHVPLAYPHRPIDLQGPPSDAPVPANGRRLSDSLPGGMMGPAESLPEPTLRCWPAQQWHTTPSLWSALRRRYLVYFM